MKLPICPFCGNEKIQNSVIGFYCDYCESDFSEDDLSPDDDYFAGSEFKGSIDPLEVKIWDYITDSAKKRFDYITYKKGFPNYIEAKFKDNILWEIIMRFSAGQDVTEISSYIFSQLALSGLMFPLKDLKEFIGERQNDLGMEILATKIATDSLNQGSSALAVMTQVNQILR